MKTRTMPKCFWFTFYDAQTDDVLACGTIPEIAKALGMTPESVQCAISRCRHGTAQKYIIVRESLKYGTMETLGVTA